MNYQDLYQSGELLRRTRAAYRRLAACDLCPHNCGINRLKGERGVCGTGFLPKIASATIHKGEEPPISGSTGSGTIFLSGCSLKCVFCQNFPISQLGNGKEVTTKELAVKMVRLQRQGAHNINFVTPTHFLPQILAAIWLSVPQGFKLPVVWNSSGYEKADALKLLENIVHIYLPDMKYSDDDPARRLSSAPGYTDTNHAAVAEMFRQVGHLELDSDGIALKGLIIRHLVLPGGLSGTEKTVRWIAHNLGKESHISLMKQFFPAHLAPDVPQINRRIDDDEYDEAVEFLEKYDLENGWVQD